MCGGSQALWRGGSQALRLTIFANVKIRKFNNYFFQYSQIIRMAFIDNISGAWRLGILRVEAHRGPGGGPPRFQSRVLNRLLFGLIAFANRNKAMLPQVRG